MPLSIVECATVKRASVKFANNQIVTDTDVVADGVLAIDDEKLTVYEYQEYKERRTGASNKLVIYFAAVNNVERNRVVSQHRRFEAGRIRRLGTFDAGRGYELITLKLHPQDYNTMKRLLTRHLGGTGRLSPTSL
jgi:hypothetical protein